MAQDRRLAREFALLSVCTQIERPDKSAEETLDDLLNMCREHRKDAAAG